MADLLQWNYQNINKKPPVSKESKFSDVSYVYTAGKFIWTNLLNKNNQEIRIDILCNSPKFLAYIEKTKKEFLETPDKFPSMTDEDWNE